MNEDVIFKSAARTAAAGVGVLGQNDRKDDEAPSNVSGSRLNVFMPMSPYPIEIRL